MNSIYVWILIVGACTVLGIWLWNAHWRLEPFKNVPRDLMASEASMASMASESLAWVQSPRDQQARVGNSCKVLDRFPDPELKDAVIEVVDASCESGLPHTVGLNQIRMPENVWNSSDERRQSILRHERIHLLQRRESSLWEDFYKDEWQYTLHKEPPADIPSDTDVRANPDTFPARWACWKGRYWFIPVYHSATVPTLQGAKVRIWDAQQKAWLDETPYEWRIQFCDERGKCPYQSEHPAEISAEYATQPDAWTTPAAMSLRRLLSQI